MEITKAQAISVGYVKWDDYRLKAVGIDRKRLERLVKKLSECGWEMEQMGLHMYGAAGAGNLIHESHPTHEPVTERQDQTSSVAIVYGHYDGGDW